VWFVVRLLSVIMFKLVLLLWTYLVWMNRLNKMIHARVGLLFYKTHWNNFHSSRTYTTHLTWTTFQRSAYIISSTLDVVYIGLRCQFNAKTKLGPSIRVTHYINVDTAYRNLGWINFHSRRRLSTVFQSTILTVGPTSTLTQRCRACWELAKKHDWEMCRS